MKTRIKLRKQENTTDREKLYWHITCKNCPKQILDMFLFMDYNGYARSRLIPSSGVETSWLFIVSSDFDSFLTSDAFKERCINICKEDGRQLIITY